MVLSSLAPSCKSLRGDLVSGTERQRGQGKLVPEVALLTDPPKNMGQQPKDFRWKHACRLSRLCVCAHGRLHVPAPPMPAGQPAAGWVAPTGATLSPQLPVVPGSCAHGVGTEPGRARKVRVGFGNGWLCWRLRAASETRTLCLVYNSEPWESHPGSHPALSFWNQVNKAFLKIAWSRGTQICESHGRKQWMAEPWVPRLLWIRRVTQGLASSRAL